MRLVLGILLVFASLGAHSEIEVIVHPSNAGEISKEEVARIFLGKTRAFPNGQEAIPVTITDSNSLAHEFSQAVLRKSQKQLKAYWAKMVFTGKGTPPKVLGSPAEVMELVANNPNLIGFIQSGSATSKVKVVGKF